MRDRHAALCPSVEGVPQGVGEQLVEHDGQRRGLLRGQRDAVAVHGHAHVAVRCGALLGDLRHLARHVADGGEPHVPLREQVVHGGDALNARTALVQHQPRLGSGGMAQAQREQ